MTSPIAIPKRVSSEKYVPVHRRSPSSTSPSPVRQTPGSDAKGRPPVYSIAELLQLSKSPVIQASLTSEQKKGIAGVMTYIPQPRRQTNNRPPSPTKLGRSASPTTTRSKRLSSPTKKEKKSPASDTASLPKVDTPPSPRRRSGKHRTAETNTNTNTSSNSNANLDSGHQHNRMRHWGYAPTFHYNEGNWRVHPGVAITA